MARQEMLKKIEKNRHELPNVGGASGSRAMDDGPSRKGYVVNGHLTKHWYETTRTRKGGAASTLCAQLVMSYLPPTKPPPLLQPAPALMTAATPSSVAGPGTAERGS